MNPARCALQVHQQFQSASLNDQQAHSEVSRWHPENAEGNSHLPTHRWGSRHRLGLLGGEEQKRPPALQYHVVLSDA